MKPLDRLQLRGNWATLLLPINDDDSIDFGALAEEIDTLIGMGVDGIYSNGTAGEFYAQTEGEFDKVSELLAGKCNAAEKAFQIGCSHPSPQTSLERVRRSMALEPSAIQVILPDWCPPSMFEIVRFLERMQLEAGDVGLVLYNPPHAKRRLGPQEFGEIREAGIRLVGCKVAGGDKEWLSAMRSADPGLAIFVPGHTLATGIANGAHGAYSNVACLHPRAAQEWYGLMQADMPKALEIEKRIQQFIHSQIMPYLATGDYSSAAVDKLLAAVGGWAPVGTRVRWPYRSIAEAEAEEVRKVCRQMLPEFFESTTPF